MDEFIKLAKSLGADGSEFFFTSMRTFSFDARGKEIYSKQEDNESGWGVRILKNKRIGFSFFSRKEDAKRAIESAITSSKYAIQSNFSFPEKSTYKKVDCFDKKVSELGAKEGAELMNEMLASASQKGFEPSDSSLAISTSRAEIANSSGLSASEDYSSISCATQCHKGETIGHDDFAGIHYSSDFARKVGESASSVGSEMLGAKMIDKGEYPVILDERAVHSFIGEILMPSFDGELIRRGASFLAGKKGAKIASNDFTLTDDPSAPAFSCSSFDGEGIPSRKKILLENGTVKNFLFDTFNASISNATDSVGNSSRGGYASPPGISESNLIISPGKTKDAIAECKNGIYIRSFFGEHTADTTTGNFSVSIDIGWLIRDGEKSIPLKKAMFGDNIFELLKCVSAESKQHTYIDFISPKLLFEKASISAE
ncbi:Zinc metalloprotease TldD [Candidatus Gugararchaeum adminiculabundum]|nr:Zinc metalloprotease TldD [Candidatus Gugararchaeum adminiculabundum]